MSAESPLGARTVDRERLLASYRGYLWAVASGRLGGRPVEHVDASDIVHETMGYALKAIREGRAPEDSAELRRFLRNQVRDQIKKAIRRKRPTTPLVDDVVDKAATTPEEALRHQLRLRRVELAVQGLAEDDRSLLIWVCDEQLSYAEIGRRLKCSPTYARRLCRRALERLKAATSQGSTA